MQYPGKIYLIVVAAVLASIGFLCSDAGTNNVETKPGEKIEVLLKEGMTVTLQPENIPLTFSNVEQDSRCPEDVVCVWQGEAEIMMRLTIQRAYHRFVLNIPGLVQTPYSGEAVEAEGYRFRLLQLDPYPRHDDNNGSPEYVARLEIEKVE